MGQDAVIWWRAEDSPFLFGLLIVFTFAMVFGGFAIGWWRRGQEEAKKARVARLTRGNKT